MKMDRRTILISKILLTGMWLFAAGSFFGPADALVFKAGRLIFWATGAVHVAECMFFSSTLRKSKSPLAADIVQVLLYGVVHYASMKLDLEEHATATGEA